MTCTSCGAANREGARFCDSCGAALPVESPREQRKVVTVLFCDVAGSTALGERLDPEALRAILSTYFDLARTVIERHGGTLEKFIGDAVMAVFGVPTIREDDALRAVRAAQELRDGVEIDVRIGVNTGEVVTGAGDSLVTGDAVNVAARLEQAAAPGEVLLGAGTFALVSEAVDVELLPPLKAKGKEAPLTAYRLSAVTGDAAYARRQDAALVGRLRERRLLIDAWERSSSERACSLFTILGSAGVGKSRLASEFLAGLDATIVHGRCLSYGEGITYWPLVEVVLQLLGGAPAPNEAIAALLGDGRASAEEIALAARKLFESAASERPLVVVFDDLQWGEPIFLDLVEEVADWSRGAPLLLLCLARPELLELRRSWGGGKLNASTVLLEPLSETETNELIDALVGSGELGAGLRERIRAGAEGNPLFVEQMLAMLAESPGDVAVPATIQALLAARLDQLPTQERAALERGAVEGQVFHRGAVMALAPDDPDVSARLLGLVRKELLRPSAATVPEEDAFRFRHLLIRDAAYDGLPKALRADLHERFAGWLQERAPALVELDEILGYHLEQAHRFLLEIGQAQRGAGGLSERAAEHLSAAGRRADLRRDSYAAANLLQRAVALMGSTDECRLALLPPLGRALFDTGLTQEVESVLAEALETAQTTGMRAVTVDVAVELSLQRMFTSPEAGLGQGAIWRAIEEAVPFYEQSNDATGLARVLTVAGKLHFWRGELVAAIDDLERAAAFARVAGETAAEVESLSYLLLAWLMGPMPVADVLARLENLGPTADRNRPLHVSVLRVRAHLDAMRQDFEGAREGIARAKALDESGRALATNALQAGPIELLAGDAAAAERELRPAYNMLERAENRGHLASILPLLADAVFEQGRDGDVLQLTESAEQLTVPEDVDGQAGWRRVRAKALARQGEFAEAERLAREAVAIADPTDYLDIRAQTTADLAAVLRLAAQPEEAAVALRAAIALHDQKGNVAAASRLRSVLTEPSIEP